MNLRLRLRPACLSFLPCRRRVVDLGLSSWRSAAGRDSGCLDGARRSAREPYRLQLRPPHDAGGAGAARVRRDEPESAPRRLTGISVDNYHYAEPAFYTPEAMSAIIASYHAAGWKHLVNANPIAGSSRRSRTASSPISGCITGAEHQWRHCAHAFSARYERHPDHLRSAAARPDPPQRPLRHPQGRSQCRDGDLRRTADKSTSRTARPAAAERAFAQAAESSPRRSWPRARASAPA